MIGTVRTSSESGAVCRVWADRRVGSGVTGVEDECAGGDGTG